MSNHRHHKHHNKHHDINQDEFKDPVCKMKVSRLSAQATAEYYGVTYYFCSDVCKMNFEQEPEKYVS